jgi:hypothetical protein
MRGLMEIVFAFFALVGAVALITVLIAAVVEAMNAWSSSPPSLPRSVPAGWSPPSSRRGLTDGLGATLMPTIILFVFSAVIVGAMFLEPWWEKWSCPAFFWTLLTVRRSISSESKRFIDSAKEAEADETEAGADRVLRRLPPQNRRHQGKSTIDQVDGLLM